MSQYNTLNVKLSYLQLNKLKSGIKNGTEVTLKISSNVIGDSNGENNFPQKLFLNNTLVSKLGKNFANNSSANIRLSKTELHKIGQSGGILGRRLGPLLKTGLPLIENLLKPLARSLLIPLGLTAAVSATDAAIHKKMFGSGTTTLTISNGEMYDMKIIKSLEESGLLIKCVSETIKNKVTEQKGGFLRVILGTWGASLLGNLLTGQDAIRAGEGEVATSWGRGTIRVGQDF